MRRGRRFQTWQAAASHFENELRTNSTLSLRTITFYKETVRVVMKLMEAEGLHTLPHQIGKDDLIKLLDVMESRKFAIATRKGYLSALNKFLRMFGNRSLEDLQYKLPCDTRPTVEWYTPDQVRLLLNQSDKTPLQSIVLHCELCLGMRRVEIIRLRPIDIHDDRAYINVLGKGPQGGKPRSIPYNKGTREILQLALKRGEEQIARARPGSLIPDKLILWEKSGELHEYSEEGWGLDKVVTIPLTKQYGFKVSNHKGRRTFGRALYRAGVGVPTIARILGHESTEVTLKYIGVDLDDMRAAMSVPIYC